MKRPTLQEAVHLVQQQGGYRITQDELFSFELATFDAWADDQKLGKFSRAPLRRCWMASWRACVDAMMPAPPPQDEQDVERD